MHDKSFTVLISVYKNDDPDLFKKALSSIFQNSLLPSFVLLIIDGPIPSLLEDVVKAFSGYSSLIIQRLPHNGGLANALNTGLNLINTQFVIRADSDDINDAERFNKTMDVLCQGYDLVGSNILEVDRNCQPVSIRKVPQFTNEIKNRIKYKNPFNHMTVGYRLSNVKSVGGYPDIYLREDYGLWALLIKNNATTYNIQENLVTATAGIDMIKRRGGLKYALAEVKMQRHLISNKLTSLPVAFSVLVIRFTIFILPVFLRNLIYRNFLR